MIDEMSAKQTGFDKGWCFDLILLTLGIALVFGLFLGTRPLSVPDEARYAEIPREMQVLHDFVTPHLNGVKYFEKPPLFYWLQAASIKLFHPFAVQADGDFLEKSISEWVVRLPNAFMALLGCLEVYMAGRLLFTRQVGLWGAIILATSFLYLLLARMVTLDMTLSTLLSGSLLSFLLASHRLLINQRRFLLYLAYSLSALAVLTKGLVGMVFPAIIIGSWILLTNQWRLLKHLCLPSGILLFLLIVLPWHFLVQIRNPEFFSFYFINQQFLRYTTLTAQRYQPDWFFIPIFLVGFLPWTCFLPRVIALNFGGKWQWIKRRNRHLFLLLWVGLIFLFFSFSHSKLIPYILPIFPALALLTADCLSAGRQESYKRSGWDYMAVPSVYLGLGIISLIGYLIDTSMSLSSSAILFLGVGYSFLLLSSLLAAFYAFKDRCNAAFYLLALGNALSFLIFSMSISWIDTRSIKPLVERLRPLWHASTAVVAYHHYYQDLPFYLNRRVIVVESRGELDFGVQHQKKAEGWMLSEDRFWPLWNSSRRIYMITSRESYRLLQQAKKAVYKIAETQRDILLSNRPLSRVPLLRGNKK